MVNLSFTYKKRDNIYERYIIEQTHEYKEEKQDNQTIDGSMYITHKNT